MQLISIIIPTYNRCYFLGATIDSVQEQTYKNWECIIVDDGSNDYTKELMEFYCNLDNRIKFYTRPVDKIKGANSCRNYGFELSKGEFINWFDSDDLMHPDFLKNKIEKLRDYDYICSICGFKSFAIIDGNKVFNYTSVLGPDNIFQNIVLQKYAIPTHGPLWRRTYLETIDLFNENLSISQDLEFHSRSLLNDKLIEILPEALFYLREENNSITEGFYKNISHHFASYFFVRKKIIEDKKDDELISVYFKNELMGMFRYLLAVKEYHKCDLILKFLKEKNKSVPFKRKFEFLRVYILYILIRIVGRGETKFKRYLYLSYN